MTFLKDVLVWGTVVGLLFYLALLVMAGMIYFVTFDPHYVAKDFLLLAGRACMCIGLVSGVAIGIMQDE